MRWFLIFLLLAQTALSGTFTSTTNFYRPATGEVGYGAQVSANFTVLDDIIGAFRATCPSAAAVGDAVYISASGTVALSRADSSLTSRVDGFIYQKVSATNARIQTTGRREGLSGLTAGSLYYLDAVTAGKITTTPPAPPNKRVIVGVAFTSTIFVVACASQEDLNSDFTFQDVYDNDTSGADVDLDPGGFLAIWTDGGTPIGRFDDTTGDFYVNGVTAFAGSQLDLLAAAAQDILLTSDGGTARLENTGEFVLSDPVVSPRFTSTAGTPTVVQAPVGQSSEVRDASGTTRLSVTLAGLTAINGDLSVSGLATALDATVTDDLDSAYLTTDLLSTPLPGTLTISGGVVSMTSSFHRIDTQAAAATDDLDTINTSAKTVVGTRLVLQAASPARLVVLKNGTGNLELGGGDRTLESGVTKELIWDGTQWAIVLSSGLGVGIASPGVSTDQHIARWVGANGTVLEDSLSLISDLGVLTTDQFVSTSTATGAVKYAIGNDLDSGFGSGTPAKEPAIFIDGVRKLWADTGSMGIYTTVPLIIGNTDPGSLAETANGKISLNGLSGPGAIKIEARTQAGTDATGRDSLSIYTPGSPLLPGSVESLRITSDVVTSFVNLRLGGGSGKAWLGLGTEQAIVLGAAATTFVAPGSNIFVTPDAGGNTISTITCSGCVNGDLLEIRTVGPNLTFLNSGAGANQLGLAGDWLGNDGRITLIRRAGHWREVARSDRLDYQEALTTGDFTTISASYVTVTGSTLTLTEGRWLVTWSGSDSVSANGADVLCALHDDGTIIAHTTRSLDFDGGASTANYRRSSHTQTTKLVAEGTTDVIDYRCQTSTGTLTVRQRSLIAVRIADR